MNGRRWIWLCVGAGLLWIGASPAPRTLDGFEEAASWTAAPSDGVSLQLAAAEGLHGRALRLDFDFQGGAGYAVARKELPFELPENYEISFRIRGEAPVNNLEFKLVDPSGDNVWWVNRKNFAIPREWTEIRSKKRHIQFAWGPAGGGVLKNVAAVEFAVTAGTGGKGSVFLDDLTLRELPPEHPYTLTPVTTATAQGITQDFLESRPFSGLVVDWGTGPHASRYEVQISDDGAAWTTLRTVDGGNGGKDPFHLPETEARHLRLRYLEGTGSPTLDVKPLDWAPTPEAFFQAVAKEAPRGLHPRWLTGEQSYWAVVGVPRDTAEGLLNEDGMLETGKGGFSIEPFLTQDGRLVTWNDVQTAHSLAGGYLPIPTVTWTSGDLALEITASAGGEPGASVLHARYRLHNRGRTAASPRLHLAVRPVQVNPAWQFLGDPPGGLSPIRDIAFARRAVTINGRHTVTFSTAPGAAGAAPFDQGAITEFLARGALPDRKKITDPTGAASAAASWDLPLAPGETKEVEISLPLHGEEAPKGSSALDWRAQLDRVEIRIPAAEDLVHTLKSNLAYILINQDGPAIQPGSRSYERSWIRDGVLTSTALLRLGHPEEVRAFLDWFAPYQFRDGKVPCCVDRRGADPVPENDSHGELIHLVAQYFRFTGDRPTAERLWPHVESAASYMEYLRQQRRTPDYRTPEKFPYLGLLPESISHEGYSDKPVHSYWDDFFALRGFTDATWLATQLGRTQEAKYWGAIRNQFRADLLTSLQRTIQLHRIDHLPASVEKGDFDPTSTAIALAPVGELRDLPPAALRRTFDRYFTESIERRDGTRTWENYTPYELRNLRALLRLGQRDRVHQLLPFFLEGRRPAGWNQWAEVVWKDPRTPRFLGDMPHTWVGAEFILAFLDLLAYVRDADGALVLGAGLPPAWNEVQVKGLRTEYGLLEYTVTPAGTGVRYHIAAGLTVPPKGIVVRWQDKETVVRELPATVELTP
ncbi:MAG TPA: coagulation factor 5/8 type domain-containing protein [Acidobacteria bacterium]|nr:coagulation factor 5/8 type domain-containing protein [Acidobacteriota bacterium]